MVSNNGGGINNTAVLNGFVITGGNANGSNNARIGGGTSSGAESSKDIGLE
ncbi:hypothetical protein GK091_25660 [Spirosoma agri]|uniref:Uncharacterized protein n=1 Tax=Spirosoma agri TaxID=1987381 RepID=A0A6M0IPT9_9BACT|nr:hypothetical protein [Spirosoma agri]NEU70288.1 hypothetical protein [Spirosoma agri]